MIIKGYGGKQRLLENRREMARRMREYFDEATRGHRVEGWGGTDRPGSTMSPPMIRVYVNHGDARWTYLDGGVDMDSMRDAARTFFEARGYVLLSILDSNHFHGVPGGSIDLQDRQGFRVKVHVVDADEQEIHVEMMSPFLWRAADFHGDDLRDPVADAMNWRVEV